MEIRAVDLPDGSIVVDDLKGIVYYAGGDRPDRWSKTDDGENADSVVDYALQHGATVTRVGDAITAAACVVVRADARERLARHLYLKQAKTDQWRQIFINAWNAVDLDRTPWLAEADELLAVITGKDN